MNIANNKILQPGFEVKTSPMLFKLARKDWEIMKKASELLKKLGDEIFNAYKNNNDTIVKFVEFGLPATLLELMSKSKKCHSRENGNLISKYPLRFDYYLSTDGPKLIEIANNPWGLMAYKKQLMACTDKTVADFPAEKFYYSIFKTLTIQPKRIGIWKHFNTHYEITAIESLAKEIGTETIFINDDNLDTINTCDGGLLIDLDTAWIGKNFPERLMDFQEFFLPPVATEIFKHKSFLALIYAIVNKKIDFETSLSENEIALVASCVVPAELCEKEDDYATNIEIDGAAIKEIVGMWAQQVTILPPKNINPDLYKKFTKHFNRSKRNKNAIIQKYIHPIHFGSNNTLYSEVSAVFFDDNFYPFVRTYSDLGRLAEPETGSTLVQIF